jgi:hypothetical protein
MLRSLRSALDVRALRILGCWSTPCDALVEPMLRDEPTAAPPFPNRRLSGARPTRAPAHSSARACEGGPRRTSLRGGRWPGLAAGRPRSTAAVSHLRSPPVGDTALVPAGCLARAQIKAIAAGRCTEKELAIVRRHLAECARCRAAVAARAGGVRGPGDTVLLKPEKAPLPTGLKLGAVAFSVAVVVGAWRYASAPPATLVSPLEPAASTAPPAPTEPPLPNHDGSAATAPPASTPPLPPAISAAPFSLGDAGAPQSAAGPAHRRPVQPRRRALRAEDPPSTRSVPPRSSDAEVDFGIDEPSPPRPMVEGRVIRTTLE